MSSFMFDNSRVKRTLTLPDVSYSGYDVINPSIS